MKIYTEAECIAAVEKRWGEIDSYDWRGDHENPIYRVAAVRFTQSATVAIRERMAASPLAKLNPAAARFDGTREFGEKEIADCLGHDCAEAKFVDGGIAVFDSHDEYYTWINQK